MDSRTELWRSVWHGAANVWWISHGRPVDSLMDNSQASYPQADTQVAHSLPTTDYFDTAIGYLYLNFSDHCFDNGGPHYTDPHTSPGTVGRALGQINDSN